MLVIKKQVDREAQRRRAPENTCTDCPVTRALRRRSFSGLAKVSCELREGVAILHGRVSTFYRKQMAQEVVRRVDGVKSVVNHVDVSH